MLTSNHAIVLENNAAAIKALKILAEEPVLAVDTETYGATIKGVEYSALMLPRARLLSFQITNGLGQHFVFISDKLGPQFLDFTKLLPHVKILLEDAAVLKVMHNANYDCYIFSNYGIKVRNVYCTMIAGACADENMPNALKERAVLVGMLLKKTRTINFEDPKELAQYGAEDTDATMRLFKYYEGTAKRAGNLQGLRRLFYRKQELPIFHIVSRMEHRGMRVDRPKLAKIDAKITEKKREHLAVVFKVAKQAVNLNSPKQLGVLLFEKLGLTPNETCFTNKGVPSTDSRSLFYLKGQHPVIEHLIEYRKLEKLQSVYTNKETGLPYYCDSKGYIHATANSVGTHTFRFSYQHPNLSTIPSKQDQFGIRDCFIAPDGYAVAVFDYSQGEVRMQVIFSRAKIMIDELLRKDGDVYLRTAREFKSPDPADERQMYKVIVLALQYGMGPWNLADQMTLAGYPMTPHEAKAKIATYFLEVYPEIPQMWFDMFQEHKRKGYFTTLLGRPRRVRDFETHFQNNGRDLKLNQHERALVNNCMQGSLADWVKQAMIRITRNSEIRDSGYRMCLQIHDEVVGIIPERNKDDFQLVMKEAARAPGKPFAPTRKMVVPIKVTGSIGTSWKAAKS